MIEEQKPIVVKLDNGWIAICRPLVFLSEDQAKDIAETIRAVVSQQGKEPE